MVGSNPNSWKARQTESQVKAIPIACLLLPTYVLLTTIYTGPFRVGQSHRRTSRALRDRYSCTFLMNGETYVPQRSTFLLVAVVAVL